MLSKNMPENMNVNNELTAPLPDGVADGKIVRKIRMKKRLGVIEGVAIIIGVILGSGIFISPGGVISHVKSVGLTLIIWVLCGVISLGGAICYTELGTSVPKSGGDYSYVYETFGELPAFLFLWDAAVVFVPCSNAIISLTFSEYAIKPFICSHLDLPVEAVKLLAIVAICFFTFLNCCNLTLATMTQKFLTLGKLVAIGIIIVSGIWILIQNGNRSSNFKNIWKDSSTNVGDISLAIYLGFFCYSGWNSLNYMTEELQDPYVNLPRAVYISLPAVTIIYLFINMAYLSVLSSDEFANSKTVAEDFGIRVFSPSYGWIMSVMVAFGSLGSLCIHIMTSSRLCFVGARCGHFPSFFAQVNVYRLTPTPCLVIIAISSVMMVLVGDVVKLITYTVFVESLFNTLSVMSLLCLRWTRPDLPRPIKVPLIIPITFVIVCIALVTFPFLSSPEEVGAGVLITVAGVPVYFLLIYWENKPLWLKKFLCEFNVFSQKMFMSLQEEQDEYEET